jgi:hypothetical protein
MHNGLNEWSARLAALPGYEAPPAGWQAVLAAERARHARAARRWPLALAAAALVATGGLAWQLQERQHELESDAGMLPYALASEPVRAENARLEWLLDSLPEQRAMRGSTAYTVAELEDLLALTDDRLSRVTIEPNAPERAERLWQQRVSLMNSLVQVRYADAAGSY